MAGATVIAQDFSADSDTVTREARNRAFAARIANAERWPDAAPHLLTPDGCPTIGDDSGALGAADYVVTGAGPVFIFNVHTGRGIGYRGDSLKVSELPFGVWKACGRPLLLRPLTAYQIAPLKLEGIPRAMIQAATGGAFSGIIEGAEPVTLAEAAATLDGITPHLWALEDDRRYARIAPGVYGRAFNVLAVK